MQQKRKPVLRAAAPTRKLDEGGCMSSRRQADRYGNNFLNHWFVEAQAQSSLPELKALGQILECNGEEWGKEELATNCLKTALGLSRQLEHVWPGLYQLAALIKERGYFTQDIQSWELKKTLHGKETFEEWFCEYIHPSFEAFTRMEEQFKLAEQTGAPLPRTINLDGLTPSQQVKVAQAAEGYAAAAAVLEESTAPVGRPSKTRDNIPHLDNDRGTSGADTYRRIQKLAREGNQKAVGLLDQIDRGETTPHAAYIELGLRRPQVTVQLEPGLHDQLKEYADSTGDSIREVVSDALEMFFRRMSALEDSAPTPEPAPAPVVLDDLFDDVAQTTVQFAKQSPRPEPAPTCEEPEPETEPEEKKKRTPCPDGFIGCSEAARQLGYSRVGLAGRYTYSRDRGDKEVTVYSKDDDSVKGVAEIRSDTSSGFWRIERIAYPEQPSHHHHHAIDDTI